MYNIIYKYDNKINIYQKYNKRFSFSIIQKLWRILWDFLSNYFLTFTLFSFLILELESQFSYENKNLKYVQWYENSLAIKLNYNIYKKQQKML